MNRRDETAAHTAVHEALANALIHADYSEQFGIRIEHSPKDSFFSIRAASSFRVKFCLRNKPISAFVAINCYSVCSRRWA